MQIVFSLNNFYRLKAASITGSLMELLEVTTILDTRGKATLKNTETSKNSRTLSVMLSNR